MNWKGEKPGVTIRHGGMNGGLAVMVVLLAACCALAVAGCSDSTPSDAPEQVPGPLVVLSDSDTWEQPVLTEADILADRVLQREDDSLLLDAVERQELADELGLVLSRIRDVYPVVSALDITLPMSSEHGTLRLGLEPSLFLVVTEPLMGQTEPVLLRTGQPEFDALNERLGLTAVDVIYPYDGGGGIVLFHFDEYVNLLAAAAAYEAVEGIKYVEVDAAYRQYSSPDIDAVETERGWYVFARTPWQACSACRPCLPCELCPGEDCPFLADEVCPGGLCPDDFCHIPSPPCSRLPINERFYFIVNDADVERIDNRQTVDIAEFRELYDRSFESIWSTDCPAIACFCLYPPIRTCTEGP